MLSVRLLQNLLGARYEPIGGLIITSLERHQHKEQQVSELPIEHNERQFDELEAAN